MSNPEEFNLLDTSNYKFVFHKLPNVVYYAQDMSLPGISTDSPKISHPTLDNIPFPGSKMNFEPLILTFLVDEDLTNLLEIYKWMYESMVLNNTKDQFSDGTLHILDGNKEVKNRITFYNMFPVSVSSIELTTKNTDIDYTVCNMQLNYSIFVFDELIAYLDEISSSIR